MRPRTAASMGAAQSHPAGDLATSINSFGHSLFTQVAAQVRIFEGCEL